MFFQSFETIKGPTCLKTVSPQKGGEKSTGCETRVNPLDIKVGSLLFLLLAVIPGVGHAEQTELEQTEWHKPSQELRTRRLNSLRRRLSWDEFGQTNNSRERGSRRRLPTIGQQISNFKNKKLNQAWNTNKVYKTLAGEVVKKKVKSDDGSSKTKDITFFDNIKATMWDKEPGDNANDDPTLNLDEDAKSDDFTFEWNWYAKGGTISGLLGLTSLISGGAIGSGVGVQMLYCISFLFLFFALSLLAFNSSRNCMGGTFAITSAVSGVLFCATVGATNFDPINFSSDKQIGILHQMILSKEFLTWGAFFVSFTVSLGVFILLKKLCNQSGRGFYIGGAVGVVATTLLGGGLAMLGTNGDLINMITSFQNVNPAGDKTLPDPKTLGQSGMLVVILGVGLVVGMFLFAICASLSAGYDYDDGKKHAYGFFKNNTARVALSLFWGVGGGAASITAMAQCGGGLLFVLGAATFLFPIFYACFFRWKGDSAPGDAPLNGAAKGWKLGAISLTSWLISGVCFTSGVPTVANGWSEALKKVTPHKFTDFNTAGLWCGITCGIVVILMFLRCILMSKKGTTASFWNCLTFT